LRVPLRQIQKFDQTGLVELSTFMRDICTAVNTVEITQDGSSVENLFGDLVAVEFSAASAHQTFSHDLRREPYGAIPIRMNLPAEIWWAASPTSGTICLYCSNAASGTLLIF
jgi:hypothetical protein